MAYITTVRRLSGTFPYPATCVDEVLQPLCYGLYCRWLLYHNPVQQAIPCFHANNGGHAIAGETLHPTEKAAVDQTGQHPRMPPGYMAADDGSFGVRVAMTDAPQPVHPSTWTTDNVLKWSSAEKLMRGRKAKLMADQVTPHPHATDVQQSGSVHMLYKFGRRIHRFTAQPHPS